MRAYDYTEDYVISQAAGAAETVAQIRQAVNLSLSGTAVGQIALWDGAAFVAGNLTGDSNGISVTPVVSPAVGLQVALTQNLKTTGSPSFAALTLAGLADTGSFKVGGGAAVTKILSATATLDFPNTAAQSSSDLTIAVTGAALGDVVLLGVPNSAVNANTCYTAWVSAAGQVSVRFNNYSAGAVDPASAAFRVAVIQF